MGEPATNNGDSARYNAHWHQSALEYDGDEYHIVGSGILTRSDYSLLFEGEAGKRHIPVEAVRQLNVYCDVELSPAALRLLSSKGVQVTYFDHFGRVQGHYRPVHGFSSVDTLIRQVRLYDQPVARLATAREFEISSLHNLCACLRHYGKGDNSEVAGAIGAISACKKALADCTTIEALMVCEARARHAYYSVLDVIVEGSGFEFGARSRRPPKNEMNAMMSFGNAMLYSKFDQACSRVGLDTRIGVVHSSSRRDSSLNLDFADVLKPVIVDRTILSLVNRKEIRKADHFEYGDPGAVLLNEEGRRVFIEKIERKYSAQITVAGAATTYEQLMVAEAERYRCCLESGELFVPYRYR